MIRSATLLMLIFVTVHGSQAFASGPVAPQAQQQPGQPITLEVDPHDALFVDPLWSPDGQGTCRYLTNPSSSEWVVPIGTQAEWQSMETDSDQQYSQNYATQQVCCRPATPADSFCPTGTVDSIAYVSGTGTSGYGQLGTTGTASAACHDTSGTYSETHAYQCISNGSGVAADGIWQFVSDTGDTCTSANTTTYGACSTAGVGGWGNQLATVKDCFGNLVSSTYSGPSCYTSPPCTTNYVSSCSGTTEILSDHGTCHNPQITITGGCHAVVSSYTVSCSLCPAYNSPAGSPNYYTDCTCDGNWAACPGGSDSAPYGYSLVTDYDGSGAHQHNLITSETCNVTTYSP